MYTPKSSIHWLGHDGFRIEGEGLEIYIDPWKISGGPKADLILITHDHFDHCSPEDVEKISKSDTLIGTIESAAKKLKGNIQVISPGESLTAKGISIETVPAYNLNKFRSPGNPFHPKKSGYVGFILTIEGERIYHAGDCDVMPEMETIQADIALLPVSGIYVMTTEEAVQAASLIKPKLAIPMHIGKGIGELEDANRFKEKSSVPVLILPIED